MRSFLPDRVIFRAADAQQIKQVEIIRQQRAAREGRQDIRLTQTWRNHVASVMGFRRYLWRSGGRYWSPMWWFHR